MALNTEYISRCIRSLENALQRLRESRPGSVEYDVFRNAARHKLIDAGLVERWAKYRDSRNNTVHHYGEELAEEALRFLSDFIKDAKLLREAFDRAEA